MTGPAGDPTAPTDSAPELRGALFADVCDSTQIYEELGDDGAKAVVLEALERAQRAAEPFGARLVDRIGDEVFLLFPTCAGLLGAAVAIQTAIQDAARSGELPSRAALRVGCQFGPVVLEGDSVFGQTVYTAKRVASIAKPHQIVTTTETIQALGDDSLETRVVERIHLKGQSQETELREVLFGAGLTADVELDLDAVLGARERSTLVLEFDGRECSVSPDRPSVTLGRDERCDFQVVVSHASRLHARVQWERGRFLFFDVSTNGSRVEPAAGESRILHRDWCELTGSGCIVLGLSGGADTPRVRYRIETADA